MNFRFTAYLFVGVVALVVALLVFNLLEGPTRPDAGLLEPLVGIKPTDIDTVEITRTEPVKETLVFTKADGKWELKQPFPAKVDSPAVDSVVRDLFDAKPTFYPDLTTNLKLHGLDNPVQITLKKGETAATVSVGETTIGGQTSAVTFMLPADRPKTPVAVRTANLRSLFRDSTFGQSGSAATLTKRANDFRLLRLLSVNSVAQGADISVIKVSQGTASFAIARQSSGNWNFTTPANFGEADLKGDTKPNPDYITGVQPLLAALESFRPTNREQYIENVPEAELAKYGLAANDPKLIRIEVTPKTGSSETLLVGKAVEANGAPVTPPQVYCKLLGDPAVVPVQTEKAKFLANTVLNPSPMRNHDLIADTRKPRIDAIDITVGATSFKIRKVGTAPATKWVAYGGISDPTEVSAIAVDDLIQAACAPRAAIDVLLEPSKTAFVPAEIKGKLKIYFDSTKPEALSGEKLPQEPTVTPNETAPPVTLTFGQATATAITVRREVGTGPATDFLLPLTAKEGELRTLYPLASRPRLQYLNPSVGSFTIESVLQVKAMRGKDGLFDVQFTEADKLSADEKTWFPKGKWVNNWTKGSASTPAVEAILNAVAGLDRSRPVAEAPPDTELAAWGLKPARLTVWVVQKADPTKFRTYEFGNEIPNSKDGGYYFRVDGKLMVLSALREPVRIIETANIADPIAYRVSRSTLTKVELGWRAETGQIDKLVLTPDPKVATTWVVAEPAGFKLDAAKFDSLLKLLEAPGGVGSVPGGEKPEYKLNGDVFKAVLQRGQVSPIEVILGAEDETKQYIYAKTSETPGVVLKLPAASFKAFLSGRKSLSQ